MTRLVASRRLFHVGILMGLAGVASLTLESYIPAAAMVPLVGALLLGLLEVLLPIPLTGRRKVELGNRLLFGDESNVEFTANSVLFPYNLALDDGVPEGLAVVPGTKRSFHPSARGVTATYALRTRRRGDHLFGPATVRRTSILGLFDRSADLPAQQRVTVLPPSARNLGVRVRPRPPTRTGRTTHALRRGPGDEFFALREYLPGDSLGDVNWKATARLQRVITNEFLPDEPPRYIVYVDTRAAVAELGEEDAFERSLQLATVLVEALTEAQAHVGLVLLSFYSLFVVPAGGANQLRRLRQLIVDAQPGHEASLHHLVLAGVPHLPARADAILITANVYDPTLGQAVTFLKARHGHVSVLVPAFPEPPGDTLEAAAQRASGALLNAEQASALAGIKLLADRVGQWPTDEPIQVTLSRLNMAGRSR